MSQNFEGFAKYCDCGEYLDVCEGWKCNGETMEIKNVKELMEMKAKDVYDYHTLVDDNQRLAYSVYKIKKAMEEL